MNTQGKEDLPVTDADPDDWIEPVPPVMFFTR